MRRRPFRSRGAERPAEPSRVERSRAALPSRIQHRAAISEPVRLRYMRIGRAWGSANWDPEAALIRSPSGDGHLVRESLCFARILLDHREQESVGKAAATIRAALAKGGVTEGTGGRFAAQTLIELLNWHGTRLDGESVKEMEAALVSIAERELKEMILPVQNGAALVSALVLAAGGDRLGNRKLASRGRDRLQAVHASVGATGAFDEYNSPVSSAVSLRALADWLTFTRDDDCRETAFGLWRTLWRSLLAHAHPPTGQLAGPWSLAAGRDLLRDGRGPIKYYLSRALGDRWLLGAESDGTANDLFPALMAQDPECPEDVRAEWLAESGSRRTGEFTARTVTEVTDSFIGLSGISHLAGRDPGSMPRSGVTEDLVTGKGDPRDPAFRGRMRRITTYLGDRFCLGTASAEEPGTGEPGPLFPAPDVAKGDVGLAMPAPLIAHWAFTGTGDRSDYLAVMALEEREGVLRPMRGAVMCMAQNQGRVLGLLRFAAGPGHESGPRATKACLAFRVNRDCDPEIVTPGGAGAGLRQGTVIRAHGVMAGLRILRAKVPGARIGEAVDERPVPGSPAEGETGVVITIAPVELKEGQEAFVAFVVAVGEENALGGMAGMVSRLRSARVVREADSKGRIRLAWGADLALETSVKVMGAKSWLTAEGEVLTRP